MMGSRDMGGMGQPMTAPTQANSTPVASESKPAEKPPLDLTVKATSEAQKNVIAEVQNRAKYVSFYNADELQGVLNQYANGYGGYGKGKTERERLAGIAAHALNRLQMIENERLADERAKVAAAESLPAVKDTTTVKHGC